MHNAHGFNSGKKNPDRERGTGKELFLETLLMGKNQRVLPPPHTFYANTPFLTLMLRETHQVFMDASS